MVHETSEPDSLPEASPSPMWVAVSVILSGDNIHRPLIGTPAAKARCGSATMRAEGPGAGVAPFRNRALTETFGPVLLSQPDRIARETREASASVLPI